MSRICASVQSICSETSSTDSTPACDATSRRFSKGPFRVQIMTELVIAVVCACMACARATAPVDFKNSRRSILYRAQRFAVRSFDPSLLRNFHEVTGQPVQVARVEFKRGHGGARRKFCGIGKMPFDPFPVVMIGNAVEG